MPLFLTVSNTNSVHQKYWLNTWVAQVMWPQRNFVLGTWLGIKKVSQLVQHKTLVDAVHAYPHPT